MHLRPPEYTFEEEERDLHEDIAAAMEAVEKNPQVYTRAYLEMLLAKLAEVKASIQKVRRVRAEIETGGYESDHRVDVAATRLLDDVVDRSVPKLR